MSRRLPPMLLTLYSLAAVQGFAVQTGTVGLPMEVLRLGGSSLLLGLLFAWFYFMRGSVGLLSGRLQRHPSSLLTASMLIFLTAMLLYAWAPSAIWLVALQGVQALAAGAYWVTMMASLFAISGPRQKTASILGLNILSTLGQGLGNLTGGLLAARFGPHVAYFAAAGLFLLAAWLAQRIKLVPPTGSASQREAPLREVLRSPMMSLAVLAAVGCAPVVFCGIEPALFVARLHAGYALLGTTTALIVVATLLMQGLAVPLARYFGANVAAMWGYLGSASALLALWSIPNHAAVLILFPLIGGFGAVSTLAWSGHIQEVAEPRTIGTATGLFWCLGDYAQVLYFLAFGAVGAHLPLLLGGTGLLLVMMSLWSLARGKGWWRPGRYRPA